MSWRRRTRPPRPPARRPRPGPASPTLRAFRPCRRSSCRGHAEGDSVSHHPWRIIDAVAASVANRCAPGRLPGEPRTRGTVRHLHVIGSDHSAVAGAEAPLIERAVEVDVLDARGGAARGRRRRGRRRRGAARDSARPCCSSTPHGTRPTPGCRVRRAAPGPLERHFPFGVVRALLETPLRDASARRARAAARRRRRDRPVSCCSTARCRAATRRRWSPTACCGCARRWPTSSRSCSSSTMRTGPTAARFRCSPTWPGGSPTGRC